MPSQTPAIDTLCFFTSANPPTVGHIAAVKQALAEIPGIQKLLIIPPTAHVWGKALVSFDDRIAMLHQTFDTIDPRIEVSTLERDNHLSGYTIDTLHFLQKIKNDHLGILMGADSIETFHTWRSWEEILQLSTIFIVPRDRILQKDRQVHLSHKLQSFVGKRIFFLSDRLDETVMVSSTQARKELEETHHSSQVTHAIETYTKEHALYERDKNEILQKS